MSDTGHVRNGQFRAAPSGHRLAGVDSGYTGASVLGAALLTICFPFVALIAALLVLGNQTDPRKRSQLRMWAWASGGWLLLGVLVAVLLAVA